VERTGSRENDDKKAEGFASALRLAKKARLKNEFLQMQDYWSRKAKEKGILTEDDLKRYLKK